MRRLAVSTFLTLDGVMQAPGGPEEDTSGGFTQGGWSVNYWDDLMGERMDEAFGVDFDLLLGRKTYEIFAAHWPHVLDDPAADKLNNAVKYVVSTTLGEADWNNTTVIDRDVVARISELKSEDGSEIQVQGSSHLIQTLLKHDLVDEFRIWIFPVVVGNGKRLFGDGTGPAGLRLLDSVISSTGVLMNVYEPAGKIPIGSFALEEPTEAERARRERLGNE